MRLSKQFVSYPDYIEHVLTFDRYKALQSNQTDIDKERERESEGGGEAYGTVCAIFNINKSVACFSLVLARISKHHLLSQYCLNSVGNYACMMYGED